MAKVHFNIPIREFSKPSGNSTEFLIKGIAINETTTRNGTKFIAEELQRSAASLRNKPILKDHQNSVDAIVGKTTDKVNYDATAKGILFEAMICDDHMKQMISDGMISNVSVGAFVKEVHPELSESGDKTGAMIVKGVDFVELSLVAVPADPHASFEKSICEAFHLEDEKLVTLQGEDSMKQNENVTIVTGNEQKEITERSQLQTEIETLKLELLRRERDELKKSLEVKETVVPKLEDKTQGIITTENVEETPFSLKFAEGVKGYALSADYKALGCKRLTRC